VCLSLITVGGDISRKETTQYKLRMIDCNGETVEIEALGLERISSPIEPVDTAKIASLFKRSHSCIQRPTSGEIDLLIGMQYAAYHPVRSQAVGHLLLYEGRFGIVTGGSHPSITEGTRIDPTCMKVKHADVMHACGIIDRFHDIEALGVTCQPRCGGCKCGQCQAGGKDMSLQDEKEYEMIQSQVKFNVQSGRWLAEYPWVKDSSELQNNRHIALAILKSTERRLSRNKEHADLYARQIEDLLDRKAAREVTEDEIKNYDGTTFYLAHHAVMKPESKSTPCRIVFNSSAKFKGLSLNDCLAKGPSLLNLLLGILMRFRKDNVAFIGDIAKMYHSIDITCKDQMTHLFLWRDLHVEEQPRTFAMTAVNMGDKPSATIAQVALRKTAEESLYEFPEASNIILDNSYMDDISASVDCEEVAFQRMKEIEDILKCKGFKIKEWFFNGRGGAETSVEQERVQMLMGVQANPEVNTEGVLGMLWDMKNDTLKFSECKKKWKVGSTVTKRVILSTVNSIYDPIGLLTPFTVKAKILLRKIWAHEPMIGWDDPIPKRIEDEWVQIRSEIEEVASISFARSLSPIGKIGRPTLVLFSDGSQQAYATVAYIRWEMSNGNFSSRLVASKSRMAPIKILDIVRIELCGALLSARLRGTIEKELKLNCEKILHIIDSEIVHAMINRGSYGFNTFEANRLGEIQRTTKAAEWMWIEGKPWLNVADVATRGSRPSELDSDSLWQKGPDFLTQPEETWPVRREVKKGIPLPGLKKMQIPDEDAKEVSSSGFTGIVMQHNEETLASRINAERFSSWKRLQNTTARILKLYSRFKQGSKQGAEITPTDLINAELFWIKEAQKDIDPKKCIKLQPVEEEGVLQVGGRTERWMECTWNKQKFKLLPKGNHVSLIIARHEHDKGGHLGEAGTISKIRSKYWIIGVKDMVKNIIRNCRKCKEKLKKTETQIMSPLPVERIKPSPPFHCIGIDYFGPFTIKGEVQKRVRGKGFGVIITCLSTRAVYIDIAENLSTDAFLKVFRRFVCIRGWPKKIFSDNGTQLVSASNELREAVSSLDKEGIKNFGYEHLAEWSFSPADAPWYNGAVEALVKSTKRGLNAMIGDQILTFSDMQTVLFEVSQLLNQRPIGAHPKKPDDGIYLCPNDILLGHSSSSVPQGPFKERVSNKFRLDFLQSLVSAFWKKWSREVFPNMVMQPKWHTEKRNLREGDVVLVQDANLMRGKWRMAVVKLAVPSEDNRIRRVMISYRSENNTEIVVQRAVQRLILLVPVEGNDDAPEQVDGNSDC